jgi:hypothetical protein
MAKNLNDNVRKTYKDYKKEYVELEVKKERLINEIRQRLLNVATANPDAIVTEMEDTEIRAKSIANASYIKGIEIPTCILYIQKIEEWLAKQNPIQQKEIEFDS